MLKAIGNLAKEQTKKHLWILAGGKSMEIGKRKEGREKPLLGEECGGREK